MAMKRSSGQSPESLPTLDDGVVQNKVFQFLDKRAVTEWYLKLRCEEECFRAERYDRLFCLLLIEPVQEGDNQLAARLIGDWVEDDLRASDRAAYLGGGRYVVLLPETSRQAADRLAQRCRSVVAQVTTRIASFPEDGRSFAELIGSPPPAASEAAERAV